jgi:ketosteroid isomerase-like protein
MGANVKVVEAAYEAFGRGDIPALLDLLDDGIEWAAPATLPQGGSFHGKEGVSQFFQRIGEGWSDLALDIESVSEAGPEVVIGVVRGKGTLRGGETSEYGAAHLFNVRGDKVTRFREYTDLDGPLA